MKRALAVAASCLSGALLAWLILPSSNTGPPLSPIPQRNASTASSAASEAPPPAEATSSAPKPAETPEPFLSPDRMPTQGVRLPSRGAAAEPSALAARNTREARFSRRLAPRWVQTRSLLQKHQSDPLVESLLEDELKPIIDSLREQRRNPDPDSFPELFQTQRRVMGLIRQTPAFNDAMQQQLTKLEDQMASYEAGDENPP